MRASNTSATDRQIDGSDAGLGCLTDEQTTSAQKVIGRE
jgi:hypothetical protein